jgi:hypothetical protein
MLKIYLEFKQALKTFQIIFSKKLLLRIAFTSA